MKQTTAERLLGCARFLRDGHPHGEAHSDYIAFGMATEYLRAFVDNEWTNQVVFAEHPTVDRGNRPGRAFMRAEATDVEDRYRNQERALRIAELLFNLQDVDGIDARVDALRSGMLESTYAELEYGAFLRRRGVMFRYVMPSGSKGADYDAEVHLPVGAEKEAVPEIQRLIHALVEAESTDDSPVFAVLPSLQVPQMRDLSEERAKASAAAADAAELRVKLGLAEEANLRLRESFTTFERTINTVLGHLKPKNDTTCFEADRAIFLNLLNIN